MGIYGSDYEIGISKTDKKAVQRPKIVRILKTARAIELRCRQFQEVNDIVEQVDGCEMSRMLIR
jgi:hypothetical protein